MAIGHSSARCWPCELRSGSFNSATSSAHKQYIRWEFSAVARTFNELLQPWWCIHCVIVHAFEVILLGDLPYKIAQQDRLSAAESARKIELVQYLHSSIKRPFKEHYYKLQVFCNKSRLFEKTLKFSSRDSSRFYQWKARIVSGFTRNSTKNLRFSVKKTSASFRKDAGVAKELQFVVMWLLFCSLDFRS